MKSKTSSYPLDRLANAENRIGEIKILDWIWKYRLLRHLLFWVATVAIATFVQGLFYQDFTISFYENMILLIPKIAAAYFLAYYQIPQLIFRRKYWKFALSFLLSAYLLMIFCRFLAVHVVEEFFREGIFVQESIYEIITDWKVLLKVYFFRVYTIGLVLALLKLIKDHFAEIHQREILEKEKATAELNFLKAQLHPHFLFNTLNNVYVLTLQKSDKAPEMLIKLSDMLDYMLYQCNAPTIPIGKELTLLENYIALERLRYGDRLELQFNQQVDREQTPIAPLILLSLMENAFKHGVSGAIKNPVIRFDLKVEDQRLHLELFNTKPAHIQTDPMNYKKGIGVSNIRRQLELIYPEQYEFTVEEKETSYLVKLHINLAIPQK